MSTVLKMEWELPEGALEEPLRADLVQMIQTEVAVRLFAAERISSGYAAEMLGISRWDFLELLKERKIPVCSYGEGDLDREIATLENLAEQGKLPRRDPR